MSRSAEAGSPTGNTLLDAVPEVPLARIMAQARRVELSGRRPVYEPSEPIRSVYFPLSAVVSLVALDGEGSGVQVATVGREGMVGLPVFFGATTTPNIRAIAQIPGRAISIPTAAFVEQSRGPGRLHDVMSSYANAMFTLAAQEVACNRLHNLRERCSRELLMADDRAGGAEFPLTHELLAEMLGVRRASVSVAAAGFQEAGLIRYRRGRIAVTDRPGLEAVTCDCYKIIRDAFALAA